MIYLSTYVISRIQSEDGQQAFIYFETTSCLPYKATYDLF